MYISIYLFTYRRFDRKRQHRVHPEQTDAMCVCAFDMLTQLYIAFGEGRGSNKSLTNNDESCIKCDASLYFLRNLFLLKNNNNNNQLVLFCSFLKFYLGISCVCVWLFLTLGGA